MGKRSLLTHYRNFEINWKNVDASTPISFEDSEATGWIAHFEVWNIETEDPSVVEDWKVPLKKADVALQIRSFRKYTRMYKIEHGSRVFKRELALHFPSSIGNKMDAFTVLRTVFLRNQSPARSNPQPSSNYIWRSVPIPMLHSIKRSLPQGTLGTEISASRSNGAPSTSTCDIKFELDQTSTYQVSLFNNLVLYKVIRGHDVLPVRLEVTSSLAIFSLEYNQEPDSLSLISYIGGDPRQGYISHVTFHSDLPLLAFWYGALEGKSKIVIWRFCQEQEQASKDPVYLNYSSLTESQDSFVSCYEWIGGSLQSMQFSATAKEIVVESN